MRHRKTGRKLGRNSAHLRALFRNMTASLLMHGRIETTLAKAKELRRFAEPVITKAIRLRKALAAAGKKPTDEQIVHALHLRRVLAVHLPGAATMKGEAGDRFLSRRDLVAFLIDDIAPRFLTRPGGYTRIRRLGFRKGDNAPLVILELMPDEAAKEEKPLAGPATPGKKPRAGFFRRSKAEATAADEKLDKRAKAEDEKQPEAEPEPESKPARKPARKAEPKAEPKAEKKAAPKAEKKPKKA
jgi:large subunit ribosomal protein L17